MTHVLFDGDIRQHPDLRSLLRQWGVTVDCLTDSRRGRGLATVEDCDAVISMESRMSSEQDEFCAMPDGAGTEGVAASAAPLLLIGLAGHNRTPWVSIPDSGPGGTLLKTALDSCRERARILRGDPAARNDRSQYRDFLGHELRSPLTSIKTALSVLDSEEPNDPGSARMVRIALRNLERLEQTVEWSQELHNLAESPPIAELVPTLLESLADVMPGHLTVHLDQTDARCEVMTDLRLLGALAGQMERVLSYACPGCLSEFRVFVDVEEGGCRLVATVAEPGPGPGPGDDGRNPGTWDHLARMLISPDLLKVLGTGFRVHNDQGAMPSVSINLPLSSGVSSHRADTCLPV